MQPPPSVPSTRPSGRKIARAPAFCGVEPEVWTTVASANGCFASSRFTISWKNCSGRLSVIDAPEAIPAAHALLLADEALVRADHLTRPDTPLVCIGARARGPRPLVRHLLVHLLRVQARACLLCQH